MQCPCSGDGPADARGAPTASRRGFLRQATALLCGAVALMVPAALGAVAFLNPLRMRSRAGGFVRVTSLEVLPEDGTPRKLPVLADRTDAWSRQANEPIGAVFLRRTGAAEVEAMQVICPHAGCAIHYEPSPEGGKFHCPCHGASFDLRGRRTDRTSPSPRDMDSLEAEIRNQTEVWVKFQDFRTGIAQKIAEA
jgi:menaquinol-cytochrome c reductase iron-sulfur subunit